jgi:hypothetical protein
MRILLFEGVTRSSIMAKDTLAKIQAVTMGPKNALKITATT